MAFFVDEYQDLHDLIVAGRYSEALTLLGELDEMSREDKLDKIGSFMDVLLIHLIKRAEDPRSTRSWEVSIKNAVDMIRRTNRNRKTKKDRFGPDELREVLEEVWPQAIRRAALEVRDGRYTEEELERLVERDAILARAMDLITPENQHD
ncbi:MAG: DUF29 family protein [Planctomycetaceae bacterium]|nr:DUF29 family protein [Planctomycetaceae bacterium]